MAHAETCPICKGKGDLPSNTSKQKETCHGCSGKGWIEVSDKILSPHYPPTKTRPEHPLYWIS